MNGNIGHTWVSHAGNKIFINYTFVVNLFIVHERTENNKPRKLKQKNFVRASRPLKLDNLFWNIHKQKN